MVSNNRIRKVERVMKLISALLISILGIGISGCTSTGDFGRVRQAPASVFDRAPHGLDREEFILSRSDAEIQMDKSVQRFSSEIDAQSWVRQIRHMARTAGGAPTSEKDYYNWLRLQSFSSSKGAYRAIINEVELDILSLPHAFAAVCKVQNLDQARIIAAQEFSQNEPQTLEAVRARRIENSTKITNFSAVVNFRYESYSYALEHLVVETPDELARTLDIKISELALLVQVAMAGQFCSGT
jgi:hypothetical protein